MEFVGMKNKLIALSDQETVWVQEEADKREITFCDMVRRIIDDRYERQKQALKVDAK
jgi:hypothetical protein